MDNGLSFTARLWMVMAKEGGWWSVADLEDEVPDVGGRGTRGVLTAMLDNGSVARREAKYGVTHACRIPNGITVRQLADAGVIARAEP